MDLLKVSMVSKTHHTAANSTNHDAPFVESELLSSFNAVPLEEN